MAFSIANTFSKQNINLVVGLITLLVVLWVIMFSIPNLFFHLFHTFLGNFIMIAFILLAALYNMNLAVGLAIVFIILFRLLHMGPNIETLIL